MTEDEPAKSFVRKLLLFAESEGVIMSVIHGYELGDVYWSNHDVDLAVELRNIGILDELILETCSHMGWRPLSKIYHSIPHSITYGVVNRNDKERQLFLDFLMDPWGINVLGLRSDVLITEHRNVDGLFVPSTAAEAAWHISKRFLRKSWNKDAIVKVNRLYSSSPEKTRSILESIWKEAVVNDILCNIQLGDVNTLNNRSTSYRKSMIRSIYTKRPWLLLRTLVYYIKRLYVRVRIPTGLVIGVIGPDGAGKSTLTTSVQDLLPDGYSYVSMHWRPRFLPPIGNILGKKNIQDVSLPHSMPSHSFPVSLLRFIYYWLDFVLGYWIKLWPMSVKKKMVMIERYFFDFFIDQRRYRLSLPKWLPRALGHFVPRPDITILLDGCPETVYERKQELLLMEISRQVMEFRNFIAICQEGHVVRIKSPINEIGNQVASIALDVIGRRFFSALPQMRDDERLIAWKWLLPIDSEAVALIIGDPPWGVLRGLSRSVRLLLVATTPEKSRRIYKRCLVENVTNIQVIQADRYALPLKDKKLDVLIGYNVPLSIKHTLSQYVSSDGGLAMITEKDSLIKLPESHYTPSLETSNRESVEVLYLLPSRRSPRFFVPMNVANGITVYNPLKWTGRIGRLLAKAAVCSNLISIFSDLRVTVINKRKSHTLLRKIALKLNCENPKFSILSGTTRSPNHRKTTVKLMDNAGHVIAYIKIAERSLSSSLLDNESRILRQLESLPLQKVVVPRVLLFDKSEICSYLVQSPAESDTMGPKHLSKHHVEFLRELQEKTLHTDHFEGSLSWIIAQRRWKRVQGSLSAHWMSVIGEGLKVVQQILLQRKLPLVLSHGDLVPWNTRWHNGHLFVFDWEFAQNDSLPIHDLLHFIIWKAVLVKRCRPEQLLQWIAGKHKILGQGIQTMTRNLEWNLHYTYAAIVFYFCDILLFHTNSILELGGFPEYDPFLHTYLETLEKILLYRERHAALIKEIE